MRQLDGHSPMRWLLPTKRMETDCPLPLALPELAFNTLLAPIGQSIYVRATAGEFVDVRNLLPSGHNSTALFLFLCKLQSATYTRLCECKCPT